jgi:vancomycin permeability regulator SanA
MIKRVFVLFGCIVVLILVGTCIIIESGLRDDLGKADIALVLGSKVDPDGTPSPCLSSRLDRTLELYRAGYFTSILVSGGIGKEGYDEATVMRDYLISHGVPRDRVIKDNQGATTYISAKNTLKLFRQEKLQSVLVVSQFFHLPRARLALKRFGISTVYSAHARMFFWKDIYSTPREVFAYISYFFRNYDTNITSA